MRTIILCFFALLLCTRARAQSPDGNELPVISSINNATVFREGAQVSRKAEAEVNAGRTTLVFTDLTSSLDPGSVQVNTDDDDLLILSVSHRINYYELPEKDEAEQTIYDRIDGLERDRRRLQTEVAIAKEEEEVLRANRDLGGSASGLKAEDLERGVTYQRERIRAIKLTYLALDDSLRANRENRELLQRQLAERGEERQRPATSEVVVVVESKQVLTVNFKLTYLVDDAGWTPEYDVRVADISRPIDLRYRAKVRQTTGENWDDIKLTLSTGNPTVSAEAPELRVWRVRPGLVPPVYRPLKDYKPVEEIAELSGTVMDENGQPLIGCSVFVTGTSVGTVTDVDGRYLLQLPEDAETVTISYTGYDTQTEDIISDHLNIRLVEGAQLDEVVVTAYAISGLEGRLAGVSTSNNNRRREKRQQESAPPPVPTQTQRRATTFAFAIELPYTIPSDGKPRSVEIKQYDVPATYRHLAVPKITADVFLSAVVQDWEQYDLISGDLQLFFEGTYLGTSYLDVEKTADSLQFSLGRDAGVVITRELDEEFRKGSGLFGGKQTESRGWIVAVRNTKSLPIDLTVLDQVPISAQGNIDVDLELPDGARLDEEDGTVTWQFRLQANTERKVNFGYRVRYPTGERVYVE